MTCFTEKRKLTRRLKSLCTHLKTLSDEKTKLVYNNAVCIERCKCISLLYFRKTVLAEIQTLRGDLNYITVCYGLVHLLYSLPLL